MARTRARVFFTRYDMAGRHYRNFVRHLTPKKLLNFIQNEVDFRRKRTLLRSLPYFIKIEPTPFCQLRCPGCVHGTSESSQYAMADMLPLDRFKEIIDGLRDYLIGVSLSYRGEPLMHPDLLKMITYCHERNIGTEFPTSLSLKLSKDKIEQLALSGLDHVMISIDGITQDVYAKYRRGGDLSMVMHNASMLLAAKQELKSRHPFVEFKYTLFIHNSGQVGEAERISQRMGFDKFSVVQDNFSRSAKDVMERAKSGNWHRRRACYWPWNSAVIRWDGSVWPCCQADYDRTYVGMGNVFDTSFQEIWNAEGYRKLRLFFRTQIRNDQSEYCERCMRF